MQVLKSLGRALSPVSILNWAAGTEPVRRDLDIAFGDNDRLRLDVYRPSRWTGPTQPTIVFFYGGGWDSGDRSIYRFVGAALAAKGFVTVIPDYRVYPETLFPGFLRDAASAVSWALEAIAGFGGDPSRLVVAGHSAGAHIAAMLAFDRQWLGELGLDADAILRGFVGLSGPYDFLPLHSTTLKVIFGTAADLTATQPINFVDRRVVPSFLATGPRDKVVDPANSIRLAERIRQQGGRARLRIYPRVSHELMIGALARPLRPLAPVLRDIVEFVAEVTAEPAAFSMIRAETA